ncbi:MAG: protein jag [Firmicutes bacterium]|nr:protein jag [Bacillota bacterium]
MARVIEKTGKTVDEAVGLALNELGVTRDNVEIEVLEEPSKGIFGIIGVRPARIRVTCKEGAAQRALGMLQDIFNCMNLQVTMKTRENDNELFVDLEGKDLGILIGRRGETLDALQYLVNLSVNKSKDYKKKIIIDIEGYRSRREETLQKLALKLADKARQRGRSVVLEPMNSQERRIIHTALQGREDIYTFSEGEEPYRKIIISPKK